MGEQTELALWERKHDLPPKWDGMPVEWGEWSDLQPFICPPPKPVKCGRCGSLRDRLMCLGRVWTEPGTVLAIGRARENRGRHLVENISAHRCPDCQHDYVLDGVGPDAQMWDLDYTDYTDEGSYDIAGSAR